MNKIFLKAHIEKSADDKSYRFLASTSSIDRQGDSIDQSGWDLKNFMRNPVILWAHRYDELPLGKVVTLEVTQDGLVAEVVFADNEANPKATQVKSLIDQGVLNAVSVGFIPKERNGNIITRSELLEISIVPVPANQDALTMAFKSMDLSLIQKDFDNVEEITEEVVIEETPTEEVIETEEKSGRTISNVNRKALEASLDYLKSAVSEIEKLLVNTEVATTENEDSEKSVEKYVVIDKELIEQIKFALRNENKNNDIILSALKKN